MMELFRVPMLLMPRKSMWATHCTNCGGLIRLGRGSRKAMERLLGSKKPMCGKCSDEHINQEKQ